MPLMMPTRVKYRKSHRGRMKGKAKRGTTVAFGEYGLQAMEPHWITSRQLEACRLTVARFLKKGGKLWTRVFPDKPISKKPAETRMGKGKGAPEFWVAVIKPGRMLFELGGVPEEMARDAFRLASHKLPIKTHFVVRDSF